MVKTWGPRWHTVEGEKVAGVYEIRRRDGRAATRAHRAATGYISCSAGTRGVGTVHQAPQAPQDLYPVVGNARALRALGFDSGTPIYRLEGLTGAQVREFVRRLTRARVAARLAAGRAGAGAGVGAGQTPEAVALGRAQIVTTAAGVVAYREQRGWSQRELADAAGVSRGLVCECERGRRAGWQVRAWVDGQRVREEEGH